RARAARRAPAATSRQPGGARIRTAEPASQRAWREPLHVASEHSHVIRQHEHSHDDQQRASNSVHPDQLGSVPLEYGDEALDGDGGDHEGNCEPQGVRAEQYQAPLQLGLRRRVCEDTAENWADARTPAGAERDADEQCSEIAQRLVADVEAALACEEAHIEGAEQVQSEQHDQDAADADASGPARGAPGREDAAGGASMRRRLLRWYYGLKYRVFRRERRPRDGRRGLIVLQIDALAYAELRRAIELGYCPTITKMVRAEGYILRRWFCGLPSATPYCQAGIFHGENDGIPAFRFYDKASRFVVTCNSPRGVQYIRDRIHTPGALAGGSSYVNLLDGDAQTVAFTVATRRRMSVYRRLGGTRMALLTALHPIRAVIIV